MESEDRQPEKSDLDHRGNSIPRVGHLVRHRRRPRDVGALHLLKSLDARKDVQDQARLSAFVHWGGFSFGGFFDRVLGTRGCEICWPGAEEELRRTLHFTATPRRRR